MGTFFTVHEHTTQTQTGFALCRRAAGQMHPAEEVTLPPYVTHTPNPQSSLVTQPLSSSATGSSKPNRPHPSLASPSISSLALCCAKLFPFITGWHHRLTLHCSTATPWISNPRGRPSTTPTPKTEVDLWLKFQFTHCCWTEDQKNAVWLKALTLLI